MRHRDLLRDLPVLPQSGRDRRRRLALIALDQIVDHRRVRDHDDVVLLLDQSRADILVRPDKRGQRDRNRRDLALIVTGEIEIEHRLGQGEGRGQPRLEPEHLERVELHQRDRLFDLQRPRAPVAIRLAQRAERVAERFTGEQPLVEAVPVTEADERVGRVELVLIGQLGLARGIERQCIGLEIQRRGPRDHPLVELRAGEFLGQEARDRLRLVERARGDREVELRGGELRTGRDDLTVERDHVAQGELRLKLPILVAAVELSLRGGHRRRQVERVGDAVRDLRTDIDRIAPFHPAIGEPEDRGREIPDDRDAVDRAGKGREEHRRELQSCGRDLLAR